MNKDIWNGKDGISITLSKQNLLETIEEHKMDKGSFFRFVLGSITENIQPILDDVYNEYVKLIKEEEDDSCDR
jgi:hypothetical protein